MARTRQRLTREDIVLAALAPGHGALYTPVQVQKLLFLLETNLGNAIDAPHFHFRAYHYGPFDQSVYTTLDILAAKGLVQIVQEIGDRWRSYQLTREGQSAGESVLGRLDDQSRNYIERASEFVRQLSFSQLVSAIYKAYPAMRANSVFQD
jgi:DNA-binding PadR family transcriptional regulator